MATPNQGLVATDRSYSISSRFDQNSAEHPDYTLPEVELSGGRRLLFERRYRKIGERELHLDLFLPARSSVPSSAIVLIHGGAWRSGQRSNFYAIADHLSQSGFAVAIPAFRLAPEAGYPAGITDINAAIGWLKDGAIGFGIDPQRIAVGGESSGGQMAALVAYSCGRALFAGDRPKAPEVSALIDIDGVLDFTDPLAIENENRAGEGSVAAQWLGGSWDRRPDVWHEASASTYVSPSSPPTIVLRSGAPRFTAGWDRVRSTLTEYKIPTETVDFPGQPHTFWLFEPYAAQVSLAIERFLRRPDVVAAKPC